MKNEINIGGLSFVGERMGTHIHITVLGTGERGHRPLCGKFVVIEAEWQAFEHAADTLDAMSAAIRSHDWAQLAEDAHGLDYWSAFAAIARVEQWLKEPTSAERP